MKTAQQDRFITVKEAAYTTGFGVSTVWSKVKKGLFPQPVRISNGMTRWRLSDIQAFIASPNDWVSNNNSSK